MDMNCWPAATDYSLNVERLQKMRLLKKIRVYDFLATCDKEDIYTMVDSSAFNDIIKSFCKKALENSSVSEQSAQDVINELSNLFNFSCEKICNNK